MEVPLKLLLNTHLIKELEKLNLWTPKIIGKIKLFNGSIQEITEIYKDVQTCACLLVIYINSYPFIYTP